MQKTTTTIIGALLSLATANYAAVTTEFNHTTTDTNLRNVGIVTLTYSIDGSGNVTLDASTNNGTSQVVDIVNGWDGAAGTVAAPGLYGTSFTLTGTNTSTQGSYISMSGTAGDGLGILNGVTDNSSDLRLDNSGKEQITWTYDGVAGSTLTFTGLGYLDRVGTGFSRWELADSDTTTNLRIDDNGTVVNSGGTINLNGAGFSLADGDTFSIRSNPLDTTTLVAGNGGAKLYSLNFTVVPEPSAAILGGLGLLLAVMRRRRV